MDERTGNRHPLCLTARQLTDPAHPEITDSEPSQDLFRSPAGLGTGDSGQQQGQDDVLVRGEFWQQETLLEHETEMTQTKTGTGLSRERSDVLRAGPGVVA